MIHPAMTRPLAALATALALPLALAPGLAQDVTGYAEVEDEAVMVDAYALSVGELEDMDVYGEGGDEVGEIEDVLMDASGLPAALVIETEGFLGLGDEDVVVAFDQVELAGDRFVTAMSEDELESLPDWDD